MYTLNLEKGNKMYLNLDGTVSKNWSNEKPILIDEFYNYNRILFRKIAKNAEKMRASKLARTECVFFSHPYSSSSSLAVAYALKLRDNEYNENY